MNQPATGPHWVKSTLSYSNGNCVEVAGLPDGTVGVRDSKHPDGPQLTFPPATWTAFTRQLKATA